MAAIPSSEREAIIERVIHGLEAGTPLAELCRQDGMPDRVTVHRWREADADLAQRIARAREAGFDAIAEQCLSIADDSSQDVKFVGEDEREVCNTEFVQRSKLRIETRLKLLAKWDPKRYGDKLDVTTGGDKLPAATLNVSGLSEATLRELAAQEVE